MLAMQVVVRKNPDATTDEERSRLETVGRFHTGVFINRICQGSLVSSKNANRAGAPRVQAFPSDSLVLVLCNSVAWANMLIVA